MFSLVEALNYRCLRYVRQPLGAFHVLVGPNASGKTTFLDVVSFLSDLVEEGLDAAIEIRSSNIRDLFWNHEGDRFELAVEAAIPEEIRSPVGDYEIFRYEVVIGIDPEDRTSSAILVEIGSLKKRPTEVSRQYTMFPHPLPGPESIVDDREKDRRSVFTKKIGQHDNFYPETRKEPGSSGWVPSFHLGRKRSTLGNLPEDESRFPVATWFKGMLSRSVQKLVLNSLAIRRAAPPGKGRSFRADGSNLPWVMDTLSGDARDQWVAHLRTALPDIKTIQTVERPDDKHRYLRVVYLDDMQVPSWMTSDGTLRLLALTLPAFLPGFTGVYLIEEPENGVHPRAVQAMYDALSSVYDAQILIATHSPVILSLAEPESVLCFAKSADGATDIVEGHRHPRLRDWKREEDFGVLFAAGVLS